MASSPSVGVRVVLGLVLVVVGGVIAQCMADWDDSHWHEGCGDAEHHGHRHLRLTIEESSEPSEEGVQCEAGMIKVA